MTKLFWNILKVSPVIAATFLSANSALAAEVNEQATSVAQLSKESNSIGQVTSVSQFSDVQPTDWAFQALQSLVERYGCIAGYPNGTYRGNRALTRYEFAAGLNACLDRVNELIATATADMVNKEDLATLQRLQEEFSAELATLRGRVDALEARTAELEANQFSTTTKLKGEAIFSVSQAFGDKQADNKEGTNPNAELDGNTTFSNRVRLSLESSFMGTDLLQTRLEAKNIIENNGVTGTNMTRLGYDGNTNNSVRVDKLNYAFNFGERIRVKIDAVGGELNENVNVFNPDFRSSGSGALSRYGRFSPIYRQANDGAGITVNFNPQGPLTLSAAYFATGRNSAANPADKNGIFDGNNTIFGQLAFKPNKAFNVGLTYARTYQKAGTTDLFGKTGSSYANGIVNNFGVPVPVVSDNYGLQATFQPSSKLTLGGWVGYTTANNQVGPEDASFFYWATTLGVKDFGRQGNTLGLIFGQPPKVTDVSNPNNILPGNFTKESGTSYHAEALYKMKISDNIMITPGLLVIFNPEHNNNNDTIYVGTLRTTFSF
ncbi:iron uptake porin [Anabaena cylindrica FACHB-243]|uniref:Cyanobacterial porin n=3 Tax=Anabaena TaxID=1163 RepID=K9ZEV2_ANACC|nr:MULTISPECIES: iron uptake porin [Anabaena]AFZ57137.1 cyanobacterial porin [Anabaena cylindrica PCC 7122]MBD2418023.1 iron uptake porin [Anabaena cylindrica FACHB-243]MBY5309685.1 iron uptake porin [Anabaena sp. CCAP 1446/1C]MCM2408771.1 iron uptake porin [Anabaena sp. CCAP 1446/1C]BAY05893.1 carbohydrate-selective porin OprB [Anabaena cylindrica PCC 7122]